MNTENDTRKNFYERYQSGQTPWDSGITPPELIEAVTGPAAPPPSRMLDLGCGTGTNCLTLARLGWRTVGIDFVDLAIEKARQKALGLAEEITRAGGSVQFIQADVTTLLPPAPEERFSLLLDLGCLNGIPFATRERYARVIAEQAAPGALFLLYAHCPSTEPHRSIGATPEEVDRLFATTFHRERRVMGMAPQGGQSMWNWLRRSDS